MDVLVQHRGQQFVWDSEKAAVNFVKHGVRFEAACDVFFDRFLQYVEASIDGESREAAVGLSADWKLLVVVHVVREDNWIRLISARLATAHERRLHENGDGEN